MPKELNDKKSYPHLPRPVLSKETAPVRSERTAQYNTKISIINKDNNNHSSYDCFIKDKEKEKVMINTQKEVSSENKSVKEVKGFQTMNVVWQVVENIRKRQFNTPSQTKEVKIKKKPDIDKS